MTHRLAVRRRVSMPPVPRVGLLTPWTQWTSMPQGLQSSTQAPSSHSRSVFTLKEFEPDLLRRDGDRVIGG